MREIKFRAFADFGKFSVILEDVSIHAASKMIGVHHEQLVEVLEATGWKINDGYEFQHSDTGEVFSFESVNVFDNGEDYYFIEGTKVMQYIGLKDKNGKEIYFGDILATSNTDPQFDLWTREDYDYTACIERSDELGVDWSHWGPDPDDEPSVYSLRYCEVVGNIYQDKHLLS